VLNIASARKVGETTLAGAGLPRFTLARARGQRLQATHAA
jgi:hypothetical protein